MSTYSYAHSTDTNSTVTFAAGSSLQPSRSLLTLQLLLNSTSLVQTPQQLHAGSKQEFPSQGCITNVNAGFEVLAAVIMDISIEVLAAVIMDISIEVLAAVIMDISIEVLAVVIMDISISRDETLCDPLNADQRFGGI
jgi:hypothetical protein